MDDRAAGVLGQFAGGDQGGDRGRGDRVAVLVDDEAAVGVAVEGEAQVGAGLAHPGLEVDDVLGIQRVGLVVGERAVQLEVHRVQFERQAFEDGRYGVPAHAVARVHHDLQRADAAQVHQAAQVGGVVGEDVATGDGARLGGRLRGALVGPPLDQRADVGETGVLADRRRARAAHLDAVVLGGVVRGGEHGAGQAQCAAGEVQLVGRAETDLRDVRAAGRRAAGEGPRQAGRGGPHVVPDHDRVRGGDLGEGRPEQLGQRLVPLGGDDAAHVIRLHDLRQISHSQPSWRVSTDFQPTRAAPRVGRASLPLPGAAPLPAGAAVRGGRWAVPAGPRAGPRGPPRSGVRRAQHP